MLTVFADLVNNVGPILKYVSGCAGIRSDFQ